MGLSANAAAERVRRLRRAGVITRFAASSIPPPAVAGWRRSWAWWSDPGRIPTSSPIAAAQLEPVTEVLHLAGAPDYQLRVACRDTAELDALLRALRLRLGAADTETKIVLRSGPPEKSLDGDGFP